MDAAAMRPLHPLFACMLLLATSPALAQPAASRVVTRDAQLTRPVNVRVVEANSAADVESRRIALEAARAEAELQRRVLQRQRKIGSISDGQLREGLAGYELAIDGYRKLRPGQRQRPPVDDAAEFEKQIVDFTDASDGIGAPSVLAQVDMLRGERGEVRLAGESLQATLASRLEQARKDLPADPRHAPARAYLDQLERRTEDELPSLASADGSIALDDAMAMIEEVQVAYTMSMEAWPIELDLRSIPAQAIVELRALAAAPLAFTTDTRREIIRGWFDYTVRKAGYKTIEGKDLNLVWAEGRLTCHLVPEDSPQDPLPCNIE